MSRSEIVSMLQGVWYEDENGLELSVKDNTVSYNGWMKYESEDLNIEEIPALRTFRFLIRGWVFVHSYIYELTKNNLVLVLIKPDVTTDTPIRFNPDDLAKSSPVEWVHLLNFKRR